MVKTKKMGLVLIIVGLVVGVENEVEIILYDDGENAQESLKVFQRVNMGSVQL